MHLKEYENTFYKIVSKIENTNDKNKVEEAYIFAKNAHKGQKRKSGEDYVTHPISVGISLWEKFRDIDLFISGLLHDTVEDCDDIDIKYIYDNFGENIGYIVDSVTKTEESFYKKNVKISNEREKILYGGMNNIGCILVKLADREHNLSTLSHMPNNKQIKKSFESQALYLPLINILDFKNKNNSIEKSKEILNDYLSKKNINTAKEFKKDLLNTCFHNFSEDIFDIVYNNSNSVVWEIQEKKLFNYLVDNGWFDEDSVDVKKIESKSNGEFTVYLIFKSGSTFDFSRGKISVSSRFIS